MTLLKLEIDVQVIVFLERENDTLSDVVAEWLSAIWSQVDIENVNLPVTIVADEGYGLNLPINLK